MLYHDRHHAGLELARHLERYASRNDVRVLGLPRGGVPVAYEVARALQAPLDVFVVRKLGVPGHEEYAMGAIASGDVRVLSGDVIEGLGIGEAAVAAVTARERDELHRRERAYRGERDPVDVAGRTVIVVDDGLATGASMRAALRALRALGPARLVAAVPVGAAESVRALHGEADEVVCPAVPWHFRGVGQWYADFSQTSDDEVRDLLAMVPPPHAARRADVHGAPPAGR